LKQVEDIEADDQVDLREVYQAVREWLKARNATIHQFVKVTEGNQQFDGESRMKQAKTAARDGMKLMRSISALIRKHNKWVQ
jgi:flagellar capping protein FliD